jgi:ABC-type uncharacterized transport system permease subunit
LNALDQPVHAGDRAVVEGGTMANIAGGYLSLYVQGLGIAIPSQFLSALPYLSTVVVLVLISHNPARPSMPAEARGTTLGAHPQA